MSSAEPGPDEATMERLALISRANPGWVLSADLDGWFRGHRNFHGSQQIVSAPTLDELETSLGIRPG